jgi:hypothetical protein
VSAPSEPSELASASSVEAAVAVAVESESSSSSLQAAAPSTSPPAAMTAIDLEPTLRRVKRERVIFI